MRTVHENESVRTAEHYAKRAPNLAGTPIDPPASPPENGLGASKAPKSIKLHFNSGKASTPSTPTTTFVPSDAENLPTYGTPLSPTSRTAFLGGFPDDVEFTLREAALPRDQLFQLLRRQIHWAEQEAKELARGNLAAEEKRKHEWLAKELVLENVLEAEIAGAERRGLLKNAGGLLQTMVDSNPTADYLSEGRELLSTVWRAEQQLQQLPIGGARKPWYRQKLEPSKHKTSNVSDVARRGQISDDDATETHSYA